jgi:hypothetical protein
MGMGDIWKARELFFKKGFWDLSILFALRRIL